MTEKQLVDMYVSKEQSKLILFGLVNVKYAKYDYLVSGDTYARLMRHMQRVCSGANTTIENSVGAILVLTHYDPGSLEPIKKARWELCKIDNRLCWRKLNVSEI